MRSVVAAVAAACSLAVAPAALAHGDHPHPPGAPTDHGPDEKPPAAPLETEGVVQGSSPTEGSAPDGAAPDGTSAPNQGHSGSSSAPTPASNGAADDNEGWRPRTISDSTWRHAVRDKEGKGGSRFVDMGHFYFELRFGPYSPNVDDDPVAGAIYEKYFGSDALFYFGMELDWLPVYIPYAGSLGAGFGWGVATVSGKAKVVGTTTDAGSDTGLTIFPMHLSGVVRFDGPLRELDIPLVPYAKVGFGFGSWSASGPNEDTAARSPSGTSTGLHLAIGGALALNAFDPSAAMSMHQATGIRYANLWAEYMRADLGSGDQLRVGAETFVMGLALDF